MTRLAGVSKGIIPSVLLSTSEVTSDITHKHKHTNIHIQKHTKIYKLTHSVVSCAVPVAERIVDFVPGGTELKLQSRRGVRQAAHTRNNRHVKCTGVY